jgi:RNA polymerase sigma-70 factor (ECF subfamily)
MPDNRDPADVRPPAAASDLESTFDLIERARGGDQAALDRLFARHLEPLQRFASGRLPAWARGVTDTDDLVQDTLFRAFKRMESFEPRRVGALQAYLRQAALNRLRDELRKRRRAPARGVEEIEIEAGDSPLERAIGREAVERYEQALERIRPEDREAIIARIELGMTFEELTVALAKPSIGAARKATQRAVIRLAEEIRKLEEEAKGGE